MTCYLCQSENYREILHKPDISIWTNASDNNLVNKKKHKCVLCQCEECGSVYQPSYSEHRTALREIYTSNNAQLSTPMGKGNWGEKRAKDLFVNLFNIIGQNLKNYESCIEIGCSNGYVLRHLKDMGFKELVGIEPSIDRTKEVDDILFLKEFVNAKLKFSRKYDLIFSVGVFEHIEEINNIIEFCRNNLNENGELFICVPDAKRQLEEGDPALFSHQHIHYYTENSIKYLLVKNGFIIKSLISKEDGLNVSAKIGKQNIDLQKVFYSEYQKKLDIALNKFKNIFQYENRVVVHGVCNSLNNILGWLNKDFEFTLVDNDITKQGKKYFNKIVKGVNDIELKNYDAVSIIPTTFSQEIMEEYVNRNFKGKIIPLIS